MGPLPLSKGKNKFVVVAIDYFTKWVEVEALITIKEQKMIKFLWKNIVCHFRIPKVVITDNGKQFEEKQFGRLCSNQALNNSVLHFSSIKLCFLDC